MKKTFLWMAAILFMGCENAIVGDGEFTDERMVEFSFSLDGTTRALPAEFFNKLHLQLFNDDGNKVFAQVKTQTIADVPLLRNRSTELSGPLFSGSGVMSVELTTDWSAAHEGTW